MAATDRIDTPWAKERLRDAGLRATAARIAVLRMLAVAAKPLSHAEVVEALHDAGFDQSTLFRCLNELADAMLLVRLDLGDQVRRFEVIAPENEGAAPHAHHMCIECGKLSCLDGFSVRITPSRGARRAAIGEVSEVLLRGRCGDCGVR